MKLRCEGEASPVFRWGPSSGGALPGQSVFTLLLPGAQQVPVCSLSAVLALTRNLRSQHGIVAASGDIIKSKGLRRPHGQTALNSVFNECPSFAKKTPVLMNQGLCQAALEI